MDDNEHGQSIIKRRVELCDSLQVVFDYDASELVMSCDSCGSYYMLCCYHFHLGQCDHGDPCHHFPIVFVDGACSQNGTSSAAAGIGGAMGHYADDQWSLAIDDAVDFGGRRTSQRAELLAAIEGVRRIAESERCSRRSGEHSSTEFVIASDSEYVVNGMTEKYPNWKENGWKKKKTGKAPVNLDLFHVLDEELLWRIRVRELGSGRSDASTITLLMSLPKTGLGRRL